MNFELYDYTVDFDFIASEEPCVLAVAERARLAVFHGLVLLLASVAMGDSRDGVHLHLAAFQEVFFVGRPTPAVGQEMRHYGGYFADVHHHGGDMVHMVLLRHLLDVFDDIEHNPELVHVISFQR